MNNITNNNNNNSKESKESEKRTIYHELPSNMKSSLKMGNIQKPFIPNLIKEITLEETSKSSNNNNNNLPPSFQSRLEGRALLLDNPMKTNEERMRSKQEKKKGKAKRKNVLNAREKKALGIHDVSLKNLRYEDLKELNALWTNYIQDLIQDYEKNPEAALPLLVKADYHGCLMKVADSKCATVKKIQGFVIKETMSTFQLVTEKNELKKIPKKDTWFSFKFNELEYTLYGNQFKCRSAERITKKFKTPSTIQFSSSCS